MQSREEILADKYVALAFRNRIKNRDLWDILWLQRQGVQMPVHLLPAKVADHHQQIDLFVDALKKRSCLLNHDETMRQNFIFEMKRFLPIAVVTESIENPDFWTVLADNIQRGCDEIVRAM